MNYKKLLEENKPLLTSESMPFFFNLCKSKKTFYVSICIAILVFLGTSFYLLFQDNNQIPYYI